eukprot:12310801-Alexandrium_andersonii.AAC.1
MSFTAWLCGPAGAAAPELLASSGWDTPACSEAPWWRGPRAVVGGAACSPSGVRPGATPGSERPPSAPRAPPERPPSAPR